MKNLEYIISTILGAYFSFFGILAIPLLLLVPCNLIDYFTGLAASKIQGEKITSTKSFAGIVKKITMYVLIFVGFGIDCMIGYVTDTFHMQTPFPLLFSAIVASWLVMNELISITENCELIGLTIPILAPVLQFIKRQIEAAADIEDDITNDQ